VHGVHGPGPVHLPQQLHGWPPQSSSSTSNEGSRAFPPVRQLTCATGTRATRKESRARLRPRHLGCNESHLRRHARAQVRGRDVHPSRGRTSTSRSRSRRAPSRSILCSTPAPPPPIQLRLHNSDFYDDQSDSTISRTIARCRATPSTRRPITRTSAASSAGAPGADAADRAAAFISRRRAFIKRVNPGGQNTP